ncbi:MAG: LytR C-terminal domain-containing protein [SAR324 cluster bacterium]|nr:LytR C-terminal domain-containing protein [SAR324 cluster bacterium]
MKQFFLFLVLSLLFLFPIVAGCSFSDPEPEEVQAQIKQERQQEKEAEKLLVQEAAATEETAAKETEAARLAKVENESALDKIEKLLKPASIEVVQPAGLSLSLSFGHMLDRFELIPDEKTPFLTFKGFFDPGQFPHIQIYPRNSKTETYVLLPNTLINSILLPEREVTSFSEEGILEKMLLEEKITKKENGEIEFQVTLTISSTEKHILVLDTEKSDSRHLTFALQKPVKNNTTNAQKQKKAESIIIDLAPPVISPREEMLLHPVTALMLYRRIDQLNITILNASPHSDSAQRLAVLLDRQQKSTIEKQIGMKLKIVNISSVREQTILPKTKIYFHANLMREALILAQILPGEQVIEPMPESRISKLATDVEIYVGKNFE